MTNSVLTARTAKRQILNTAMQYIYVKSLSLEEGADLLQHALLRKECGTYMGESIKIPKRIRAINKLPVECSCCKNKVDGYAIAINRSLVQNPDTDMQLTLVATVNGRFINVDHIIPLSLGGIDNAKNMQFTCWLCNSTKGQCPTSDDIASVDSIAEVIKVNHTCHVIFAAIAKLNKYKRSIKSGNKNITSKMLGQQTAFVESLRPLVTALFKNGIKVSDHLK